LGSCHSLKVWPLALTHKHAIADTSRSLEAIFIWHMF
jgi:hypothetical protein